MNKNYRAKKKRLLQNYNVKYVYEQKYRVRKKWML